MGSYDGAEICELVDMYRLDQINKQLRRNVSLYRDNGPAIVKNSPREVERIKKSLCGIFTKKTC